MPAPPALRALLDAVFAPAPAAGPVALLRAAAELRARSSGALTTSAMLEFGRPIEGGPWCPRLFGALEPLRCRCDRLVGPEHRGETCERCHVLCTASRCASGSSPTSTPRSASSTRRWRPGSPP